MESPPISPLWSGALMACGWLFLGTFFFVVDINLVSSRLLRWPERVEWSHLGLTVLRSSIVWSDSLSDAASALPRRWCEIKYIPVLTCP